jgi:hypothetical protein
MRKVNQYLSILTFTAVASLALFGIVRSPAARGAEITAPAAYCAKVVNDDETRPPPATLVFKAARALGMSKPDDTFQRITVWRCMNSRVLVCYIGANIPCYKPDEAQALKGATEFCHEQPDAIGVPMAATGHGTIYMWSCRGTDAVAKPTKFSLDARGFIAELWKAI